MAVLSVLEIKKWRLGGVTKDLAEGHTAFKWQSPCLKLALTPQAEP